MFIKFINDRRIRRFWEEEGSREAGGSSFVRVSANVWQRACGAFGGGDGNETGKSRTRHQEG